MAKDLKDANIISIAKQRCKCLQKNMFRGFIGCHYIRVSSHKLLKGQSREGEKLRSSIPVVQCDNRPRSIASNCKQLSHALDQSLQRCRYVVPRKRRKPQRSLHLQPR